MTSPWTKYAAAIPPSHEAVAFSEVRTIMHVRDALRTLEDGKLSARLVYDESILNQSRLGVVWSSANQWSSGSIYGSVEFVFSWPQLADGRSFYWVEVIEKYKPNAFRIMVADPNEPVPKSLLTPYDPETDDGPLRFISGHWYRNAKYTSEFMFTGDVGLDRLLKLSFVTHHPKYCRYGGVDCPERSTSMYTAAARIAAQVLANGLHSVDDQLSPARHHAAGRNFDLDLGINTLWLALAKGAKPSGSISSKSEVASLVRGALSLYANGQISAAKGLASMAASAGVVEAALVDAVEAHFGVSGWTLE